MKIMSKIKGLGNKGVMSIISLIIILTIVLIASGFLTILQRTMAVNEVQGVMDTAGLLALRQGVDADEWRQERIVIDSTRVSTEYRKMLQNSISTSESGTIKSFTVDSVKIHEPNSPGLDTLGIPNGEARDQYYLESIVTIKLNRMSQFGPSSTVVWGFYDFFYGTSGKFQGVSRDPSNSNEDVMVIRSVTRLVLR